MSAIGGQGPGAPDFQVVNRLLPALLGGQLGLHSAMAGIRLAMSLQALREGFSPWAVGVLLALFAALPVFTALPMGRLADRRGYHAPFRLALVAQLLAVSLAILAAAFDEWPAGLRLVLLCVAAALSGASANTGVIAIQRTASRLAPDATQRLRVFSWLGVAPPLSNVIGPVTAGLVIDAAGFVAAYTVMLLGPLASAWVSRRVPREAVRGQLPLAGAAPSSARDLLRAAPMRRLLGINWLMSAAWDVHAFAVPVLGHERGFAAGTIGLILGTFTLSVTLVRAAIPLLAERLPERTVLRAALLWTGGVLLLYPWVHSAWLMGLLAALLGLSQGAVQPMIMTTLHRLTPDHRHGEAIALRSMISNGSSSLMPLVFGLAGTAVGPSVLFWAMGAAAIGGSRLARRL